MCTGFYFRELKNKQKTKCMHSYCLIKFWAHLRNSTTERTYWRSCLWKKIEAFAVYTCEAGWFQHQQSATLSLAGHCPFWQHHTAASTHSIVNVDALATWWYACYPSNISSLLSFFLLASAKRYLELWINSSAAQQGALTGKRQDSVGRVMDIYIWPCR